MGVYRKRQLRAAVSLLLYPMLATVFFIIVTKMLFSRAPKNIESRPFTAGHKNTPSSLSKTLVVASTTKDDRAWLSEIPPSLNWTIAHYRVDKPLSPALSVPSAAGNEAMVYLTYIIDNYNALPDIVFFHHAHLQAWHQKLDSLQELARLRPQYILKAGYASTRCLSGCENIVPLEGAKPGDWARFPKLDRKTHLATLLHAFLEPEKGEEVPSRLAAPCCAQFAVSGERIRMRSLDWWVDLRNWLINTPLQSLNSGRLMEHLWHVWFGMPAELCPSLESCRCHVFGIGDHCEPYLEEEKYM